MTFKMSRAIFMFRTPVPISLIKLKHRIVPTSIAQSFRVEAANLDQTLLDALAASVLAYVPPTTTTKAP